MTFFYLELGELLGVNYVKKIYYYYILLNTYDLYLFYGV